MPTNGISWPNISLDQSGIVSSTLNFLKRGKDETFECLIFNVVGVLPSERLKSPSLWIKVLSKAAELEPGCRLHIAKYIGPLVGCMCNDIERLFFKSGEHWRESIIPFIQLISDMIISSTDWKVENTLFKHERLLASIVQWSFWAEEHRPDIVEVLGVEKCAEIVTLWREIVGKLVKIAADNPSAQNGQLLSRIGCIPVISKDYDPNCMISYTSELILIRCMKKKSKRSEEELIWVNQRYNPLNTLQSLMEAGDCVDKDVITGIIRLGINHIQDYDSAVVVVRLSAGMLRKGTDNKLCDARIAAAVRTGLLEMCLNLVDHFGGHESFCDEDKSLYNHIESIFYIINDISLHQKTAKAIRSKKIVTEDKLVRLADTITENDIAANDMSTAIIYNDKCKDLLDMVRSILNLSGSYCCRCNKSLSKQRPSYAMVVAVRCIAQELVRGKIG